MTEKNLDSVKKGIRKQSLRGALAQYANPSLTKKDEGAWDRATAEKHHPKT